jgi:hypothetical protein
MDRTAAEAAKTTTGATDPTAGTTTETEAIAGGYPS